MSPAKLNLSPHSSNRAGTVTSRVRFRRAETRDLRRILRIEHASFGEDAWDRDVFVEYLRHRPKLFLVAEANTRLAGYIITSTEAGKAELVSIAVAPRDRRHGIGNLMLRESRARLRRRDVGSWWLMVRTDNEAAIRFYRRFGFVIGRLVKNYYEDGSAAWCMWLAV